MAIANKRRLIVAVSTFPKRKDAEAACRRLVEKGIAACASIIRINSIYKWKGRVC